MDGLPERVQPMGLSDTAPQLGRGQVFRRAGARPKKRGDVRLNARAERVRKMKEKTAVANAAKEKLKENETNPYHEGPKET